MPVIRPATAEDAAEISRIQILTWRATYHGLIPEQFLHSLTEAEGALRWQQLITSGNHVHVAEDPDQPRILGFASAGPIREPLPGYQAELYAIYVQPNSQKKGIGTALLQASATYLRSQDLSNLIAWVLEANASVAFYQRHNAQLVASKFTEIGGAQLPIAAYGWPSLDPILAIPANFSSNNSPNPA